MRLAEWYRQLVLRFENRTLDVNRRVIDACASLLAREGRPLPTIDSLIAATAMAYDLIVVTRNTDDISRLVSSVLNPWQWS
jgi:predicted nucleic acid-binding protein